MANKGLVTAGRWSLIFLLSFTLLLTACSAKDAKKENAQQSDDRISIVTTIAQIAEPLQIIGGDRVTIVSLMGPGVDPHLYNATQGDIGKMSSADIVMYSGLHLEGNMTEVFEEIGKRKPVVALAEVIPQEQLLRDEEGNIDPHVWFDIDLWTIALEEAAEVMKEHSPADAAYFEKNKIDYFKELDRLKVESEARLGSISKDQRVLVTAHDAFGYFGRMYDLEVVGLQGLSTEDEIGITDINDTIDILLRTKVPAVFVESSINKNSIHAVIEGASSRGLKIKLGGELYSDAMGDEGTPEGSYIGMYQHNVTTIAEALQGGGE